MTSFVSDLLSTLAHAMSVGGGLIFLVAGIEKFRHREILPGIVANYRVLPPAAVQPMAAVLPPVECLLGVLLLLQFSPLAAVVGSALLLTFAAAMAVNIRRGRDHIHCGCGRPDLAQHLRWSLVIRNTILAAGLALFPFASTPLGPVELTSAAFGGIALFIANRLFEAIGVLATQSRIR